jgi:hypothetical protein
MPVHNVVGVITVEVIELEHHCIFELFERSVLFCMIFVPSEIPAHALVFLDNTVTPLVIKLRVECEKVVKCIVDCPWNGLPRT